MAENPDPLKPLDLGGTGLMLGIPLAMNPPLEAVWVTHLETLAQEWDRVSFCYQDRQAVLLRIPQPKKHQPRILEIPNNSSVFLTAHQLVCPKSCTLEFSNSGHLLVCSCQQSIYDAQDGSVVSGPGLLPLRGIQLEVRAGAVWATGFVE